MKIAWVTASACITAVFFKKAITILRNQLLSLPLNLIRCFRTWTLNSFMQLPCVAKWHILLTLWSDPNGCNLVASHISQDIKLTWEICACKQPVLHCRVVLHMVNINVLATSGFVCATLKYIFCSCHSFSGVKMYLKRLFSQWGNKHDKFKLTCRLKLSTWIKMSHVPLHASFSSAGLICSYATS